MAFLFGKDNDKIVTELAGHQSAILAFIHSMIPGDASVNDVLQRTNIVIWKKRKQFKQGTKFKSWAFSIAYWEVRAHLKQQKRESWLVVDEDLVEMVSSAVDEVTDEAPFADMSIYLEQCMSGLRPQDQELIHRHYFTEGSLKEYAEELGRPVTSLKTTLGRLRVALRKCLDGKLSRAKVV